MKGFLDSCGDGNVFSRNGFLVPSPFFPTALGIARCLLGWLTGLTVLHSAMAVQAGPVEEFLATSPTNAGRTWLPSFSPWETIPAMRKTLGVSTNDVERGIAVGRLSDVAEYLAGLPKHQAAAVELLENDVFPNLRFTKAVEQTSGCSWSSVVFSCRRVYRTLNDRAGMERCHALLYQESPRKSDREMVTYLRAYDFAQRGEYQNAIATYNFLPTNSPPARHRKQIVAAWAKMLKEQQAKTAAQAGKAGSNKPAAANSKTYSVSPTKNRPAHAP